MKVWLTDRLRLRELNEGDALFAFELNADPEVIRYTGDDPFESIEDAGEFLKNYQSYIKYGFGRWGVEIRETGELIGWCGLKYTPELDEFDVGFRFFKQFWNQGFATEAAMKCLEIGFQEFAMDRIVGRAMTENLGSIRVLQKIGLFFVSDYKFDEEEGVLYAINQDEYFMTNV